MEILQVQNLSKSFDGVRAVDALSFGVKKGTITALIGPNGSGKTVSFNLITGFYSPSSGKIFFKGKDITHLAPHKIFDLGIGRTFQNIRLFPQISVLDNVMLALSHEKMESFAAGLFQLPDMKKKEETNHQKAEELLKLAGLIEKKDELAENLSYGQKKLLELARTLALDPKLLLLDEPTAGLFPETKKVMFNLIKSLKEKGKTVLFIEHNLRSVMETAEKIIVLDYGRKIAEGKPDEIKANKEVQKIYLGKSIL